MHFISTVQAERIERERENYLLILRPRLFWWRCKFGWADGSLIPKWERGRGFRPLVIRQNRDVLSVFF